MQDRRYCISQRLGGKKKKSPIYIGDLKGEYKMIPKECYEEYGKDLDGCSTQSSEGCGRCSLNKNEVNMSKELFKTNLYIEDLEVTIKATKEGAHVYSGMIHVNKVVQLLEEAIFFLKFQQTYINNININYEELKINASKQDRKIIKKENPISIHGGFDRYRCPTCNDILTFDRKYDKFCLNCGQKLNWEE
jgi:hypothetical protein